MSISPADLARGLHDVEVRSGNEATKWDELPLSERLKRVSRTEQALLMIDGLGFGPKCNWCDRQWPADKL